MSKLGGTASIGIAGEEICLLDEGDEHKISGIVHGFGLLRRLFDTT